MSRQHTFLLCASFGLSGSFCVWLRAQRVQERRDDRDVVRAAIESEIYAFASDATQKEPEFAHIAERSVVCVCVLLVACGVRYKQIDCPSVCAKSLHA